MHKRLNAVMFAVALVTLLVGVMWASLRTYYVTTRVNFDTVIWNDRQLVLFLNTYDSGASMRVFEALPGAARRLLWGEIGGRYTIGHSSVTIVRFQDGALTRASIERWRGERYPRFVEGRPYLLGGVWTGQELVPIDVAEERRISTAPRKAGGWHYENALFFNARGSGVRDITVRVGGEAMTLRTTRAGEELAIELIRPAAPSLRLWSASTGERGVSAAEFDQLFPPVHRPAPR